MASGSAGTLPGTSIFRHNAMSMLQGHFAGRHGIELSTAVSASHMDLSAVPLSVQALLTTPLLLCARQLIYSMDDWLRGKDDMSILTHAAFHTVGCCANGAAYLAELPCVLPQADCFLASEAQHNPAAGPVGYACNTYQMPPRVFSYLHMIKLLYNMIRWICHAKVYKQCVTIHKQHSNSFDTSVRRWVYQHNHSIG